MGDTAAIVYAGSVIRLSVHIKSRPPSALVGTERRDLRVDYLSGIDWFCLDGLYVIKVAAIVAISDGSAAKRVLY